MVGDEEKGPQNCRPSLKTHASFNNYPSWKHKLRENCFKRVREDRTRLLWKLRLPECEDHSPKSKGIVNSTFRDIVSDELRKIKETSFHGSSEAKMFGTATDDKIWEYDCLYTAYEVDCEEILLETQRIFYEDLMMMEETTKVSESYVKTMEDEEDEYLAHAVYEHMQLNSEKVKEKVYCPVCKRGELHENGYHIYCNQCELKLKRGDEVNLNLLQLRLGEVHAEHLDRGCRLRPEFCTETIFELTALYIKCQGCNTFEVVL
ncbi:hypothetical protein ACJIZ3_012378 [Penstemon smallii]|uniref:RPA-interacting protein n=1 Tax=Penstemon smallii TaxID=265156 RepID=A0ABD3UNE9_9LAMI